MTISSKYHFLALRQKCRLNLSNHQFGFLFPPLISPSFQPFNPHFDGRDPTDSFTILRPKKLSIDPSVLQKNTPIDKILRLWNSKSVGRGPRSEQKKTAARRALSQFCSFVIGRSSFLNYIISPVHGFWGSEIVKGLVGWSPVLECNWRNIGRSTDIEAKNLQSFLSGTSLFLRHIALVYYWPSNIAKKRHMLHSRNNLITLTEPWNFRNSIFSQPFNNFPKLLNWYTFSPNLDFESVSRFSYKWGEAISEHWLVSYHLTDPCPHRIVSNKYPNVWLTDPFTILKPFNPSIDASELLEFVDQRILRLQHCERVGQSYIRIFIT